MAAFRTNGCFGCQEHSREDDAEEDRSFCACDTARNASLEKEIKAKYVFVRDWESTLITDNNCFWYDGGTSALTFGARAACSPRTFARDFLDRRGTSGGEKELTGLDKGKRGNRSMGYNLGWFDPATTKEHLSDSMLEFWTGRVSQWNRISMDVARNNWNASEHEVIVPVKCGKRDHPAEAAVLPVVRNHHTKEVGFEILVV